MGEKHRFRSVVEPARGPGATVVLISPAVATALGGLKQMRVIASLNGVDFNSSTYPWKGTGLYMGVPKAVRERAGVTVGDEVGIQVERDERPRVLELAPELEQALAAEPDLRARFDALSFSRRRELADPVMEAVKPETRAARVAKALSRLRELA